MRSHAGLRVNDARAGPAMRAIEIRLGKRPVTGGARSMPLAVERQLEFAVSGEHGFNVAASIASV